MRLQFHRACVAAALALVPVSGDLRAQTLDLRGSDEKTATFPTSPSTATILSPDNNSPSLGASGAAADVAAPLDGLDQNQEDANAPNYGKRKGKKPKLYKPDAKTSPPLPALVPYRGAPGPQRKVLNPRPAPKGEIDAPQPGPTVAVIPSPPQLKRVPEERDPYAPTGVRVGNLRLLPYVEASTGYETNPNQVVSGVKASAVLRAVAGVDVASDFSNHSLTASLRGGYSEFPSNSQASRPDVSGIVDGRIDVTRNDQINLEARFTLATQTPGSVLLAVPNSAVITNRPLITSTGATLGGAHTFNRLTVGLRGTFDRTVYGDATQSDGTIYQYSRDNYNDYGLVARAGYELTPAIIPFTEIGADARVRDTPIDLSGYRRSSVGVTARAGSTFEVGRLLTGTASAGYLQRHYDDPRLQDLRGPTVDGTLVYAATPLTTITARASTVASETTLAGASGALSRSFGLEVSHVLFRHFTITGIATYQQNDYQGITVNENFTTFALKGAYSVTRDVQLIASATRQKLTSTLQNNNFTDNIFLVGVRLQR